MPSVLRLHTCALAAVALSSVAGCPGQEAPGYSPPVYGATDAAARSDGAPADAAEPASDASAGTGDDGGGAAGGDAAATGDGGTGILPGLHVDLTQTSASGISAGGYMAVQFHVAFSSIMRGVAVFAGGPFYCAQAQITNAYTHCMYSATAPDVAPLVQITRDWASAGAIDDPAHLAGQNVFLFGGADDTTVYPAVVDALETYYASFVGAQSIASEKRRPATQHTMPTIDYGTSCDVSQQPWLGVCNYDGAGRALAQIYGALAPAAKTPSGTFLEIHQGAFLPNPASHSVADTGYAYVPKSCASGETCRVHVSFHGCEQSASLVGDAYYKHAGYNEWADTNHVIVVYPQTIASTAAPMNPKACWDWWGYDSPDYAKKTGPQMAMVRAILDHLASGP